MVTNRYGLLCRWTVRPLWLLTVMDCCVDGGEAIVVTNRYGLLFRWTVRPLWLLTVMDCCVDGR